VRFWRHIPLFCAALVLFAIQCRAQCVAVPHTQAESAPECPLHKSKAPVESKCSHAPQWDSDDSRQFVADVPAQVPYFAILSETLTLTAASPAGKPFARVVFTLRL
jgi:hypothetical protein